MAFAIGRKVGNAVTRNRIRRRLREILRSIALPVGDYLIGVSPTAATWTYAELQDRTRTLIASIDRARTAS